MARKPKVVPMPKISSNEKTLAVRIVAGILAPIARMMFKVEVINLDKLPKSGA